MDKSIKDGPLSGRELLCKWSPEESIVKLFSISRKKVVGGRERSSRGYVPGRLLSVGTLQDITAWPENLAIPSKTTCTKVLVVMRVRVRKSMQ